jgi:DNA-binding transcriptional regulator YdaS (Cro superfamily)
MNQTLKSQAAAALARAIATAGSRNKLARQLGISREAVSQWQVVPLGRCLTVEQLTGVPRHELRPDLFDAPAPAAAA